MKTILATLVITILSILSISAHPEPCGGTLSWTDDIVQINYNNGEVKTMDIIDYYADVADDMFIISATDDQGAIMRVVVRESMLHFTISIEHNNGKGVYCTETQVVSKS
jgi:hypothetical protein